jgi:CrcB protein
MGIAAPLLVLLGGFLGGIARFGLGGLIDRRSGADFPWGTLAVNVSGSAFAGVLAGLAAVSERFAGPLVRDFLVIGFCGGFTTVSTFAIRTVELALDGAPLAAALNTVASAVLAMLAVAAGFWGVGALAG